MEAEHDELAQNPFFQALLKRDDLLQQIAKENAIVSDREQGRLGRNGGGESRRASERSGDWLTRRLD
jgi:hypothetical protein